MRCTKKRLCGVVWDGESEVRVGVNTVFEFLWYGRVGTTLCSSTTSQCDPYHARRCVSTARQLYQRDGRFQCCFTCTLGVPKPVGKVQERPLLSDSGRMSSHSVSRACHRACHGERVRVTVTESVSRTVSCAPVAISHAGNPLFWTGTSGARLAMCCQFTLHYHHLNLPLNPMAAVSERTHKLILHSHRIVRPGDCVPHSSSLWHFLLRVLLHLLP